MIALLQIIAADVCGAGVQPTTSNPFTSGIHLPFTCASTNELQTVLRIAAGVLGAIALLVLTINALRYIISQGDSGQTAKAKNGILYAIVGLVVSLSAYAIVTYVLFNVT